MTILRAAGSRSVSPWREDKKTSVIADIQNLSGPSVLYHRHDWPLFRT
jgi:hypothetical protein